MVYVMYLRDFILCFARRDYWLMEYPLGRIGFLIEWFIHFVLFVYVVAFWIKALTDTKQRASFEIIFGQIYFIIYGVFLLIYDVFTRKANYCHYKRRYKAFLRWKSRNKSCSIFLIFFLKILKSWYSVNLTEEQFENFKKRRLWNGNN